MRRKKLLIIIDNLIIGGGQNVVFELVKNIDTSRYEVVVMCYGIKRNTSIEMFLEDICKVIYMNVRGHIKYYDVFRILRRISAIKPDIIHAHLGGITFALPWCLLHRKPIVITAHTIPEKAFNNKNEKQLKFGLKYGKVMLVAVSEDNCAKCKRYFSLDNSRCRCVNNGVDKEKYYIKPHVGFNFINVATHNENKNQAMIIECFARLCKDTDNSKLILVGDGPTHMQLVDLAQRLSISDKVEFAGLVANPEVYYHKADVYVQSSHREAMPMSVLEAMMAGMPVIATDVGGLSDVIKENGFLVEDGNQDDMYASMKKLIHMEQFKLNIMKKKSRVIAEEYSSESMAFNYMAIFDEMLSERK